MAVKTLKVVLLLLAKLDFGAERKDETDSLLAGTVAYCQINFISSNKELPFADGMGQTAPFIIDQNF